MSKTADDIPEKMQEALFTEILRRPENHQCADCSNKSPTWASINFGVFLCIRCSGIHRQLGPHITRVKSAKLDKWKRDQVEIMTSVGNKLANDFYEFKLPKDFRRQDVNTSPEECTRFVREKYIKKSYAPPNYTDPITEFLLNKEKGLKVDLTVAKVNPAHIIQQQQFKREGPLVLRKKSFSLEESAKEAAREAAKSASDLQESSTAGNGSSSNETTKQQITQNQSGALDLFSDMNDAQSTPTNTNSTNNNSINTSSAFEFDFSAIESKNQSQSQPQPQPQTQTQAQPQSQPQGAFGQFQQQQQQPENKASNPTDLKSLYQQSNVYNNPYGVNPMMMMNNGFNPYMAQQLNANGYPQQMAGFPQGAGFVQMNQGYPNQFNNGMQMMNGVVNPNMMMQYPQNGAMNGGFSPSAYGQQGYNPQMMNGGFTQGMNNMQQQPKPNNLF